MTTIDCSVSEPALEPNECTTVRSERRGLRRLWKLAAAFALIFWFGSSVAVLAEELVLPAVFSDHMVLQRDREIQVWGWDEPGQKVTVTLGKKEETSEAGEDGKWIVRLPALPAGGPYSMSIQGTDTIQLDDVLIGEVWLCSGQSNMEWSVRLSMNADQEIQDADHPRIRHIKLAHRAADSPLDDVPSDGWKVCSPETVGNFSAVGYYFAKSLREQIDVPVGLIGCNWGGTRIEPWTPPIGFAAVPALREIHEQIDRFPSVNEAGEVDRQSPTALYNGMVHSLNPYGLRGTLWYQGESNNGEGMAYFEKKKALVHSWRMLWQDDQMPFYFVQLAPYRYDRDPEALAEIWEAQQASLELPHTGMAVTVDIGDVDDIHPTNKQEVGRRLALWALAKTYGQPETVHRGPVYRTMRVEGDRIRLYFDHAEEGLMSSDGEPLSWFTIAGDDKQFVDAQVTVDGNTLVVASDQVKQPVAVRFAWHQLAEPNLANSHGLPAAPFRTDGPRNRVEPNASP